MLVLSQTGFALAGVMTSLLNAPPSWPPAAANAFSRTGNLLEALQEVSDPGHLTQHVAGPVAAALVGPVQQGDAPAEAAGLLARVVKQFGAGVMVAAPSAALPGSGRLTGTCLPAIIVSPGCMLCPFQGVFGVWHAPAVV